MSYPHVVNEVASAINSVIVVIAWTVLKALPAILAMVIALSAFTIFIESMFESESQPAPGFLAQPAQTDLQMATNDAIEGGNAINENNGTR